MYVCVQNYYIRYLKNIMANMSKTRVCVCTVHWSGGHLSTHAFVFGKWDPPHQFNGCQNGTYCGNYTISRLSCLFICIQIQYVKVQTFDCQKLYIYVHKLIRRGLASRPWSYNSFSISFRNLRIWRVLIGDWISIACSIFGSDMPHGVFAS